MRKGVLVTIIVVIILVIGAAIALTHKSYSPSSSSTYSSNSNSNQSASNQPASGTIDIRNMMFTPSQITVAKGGTVTWTNNDSTTHTVVDDLQNVGGPNSGDIAPGTTYKFTFTKTGSYQYHCSIHPSMRGTIVVK